MRYVKLLLPFNFQMVRSYDEDINDLSMGISLEEIIEEIVRHSCLRRDIKEWLEYVTDNIFYEHVSNDMLLMCQNYLDFIVEYISKAISVYVDKMYVFNTVSDISFDYKDNSIIVEGFINDGYN